MESLLFTNWTDEDFTGYWDGVPYPIKKGQSVYFEDWKARHFAKHLVDREMNKLGKATNDPSRELLVQKCFGESVEIKAESDILNMNKKTLNVSNEISKGDEVERLKKIVEEQNKKIEALMNKVEKPEEKIEEKPEEKPVKIDKRTKEYKSKKEEFEGLKDKQ